MAKRKEGFPVGEGDKCEITPLGAGSEVGRSCVHMTYKGKTVLFDCGIHPAYSGMAGLPFFDEIDPSTVDLLLVTHFHLDHCASLPYFLEKTTFKGRVFMTHPTKAIYKVLLTDFVKISRGSSEDMLYREQDILKSLERIEVIDFHQTMEVDGIKFWCYTAGHVLGAAMFTVDIAGMRVLYTGDYSREEDRHLKAAEMPPFSPDICIIESTYGIQVHQSRAVREGLFTSVVHNTVKGGGRVLIPAFALGRAQELLLILEEYWAAHPELQGIPIYYASPLAKRCMAVYQTYISAMNDRIRKQHETANPFDFKHIENLRSIDRFEDTGPAVVMASPGMLQNGLSRQLFDLWCQDKRNTCIIPGYSVEGTLAKTILNEPKEVTLLNGQVVPLRMAVHYISFSAHADCTQTTDFLSELRPPNIILVHGEATEMGRLKGKLTTMFAEQNTKILTPKNTQTVELFFKGEKTAKAVGRLADKAPHIGQGVSGLLVRKGFTYQLMAAEDLGVFTQLATGSIMQRQSVPYHGPFSVLRSRLEQMFEGVDTTTADAIRINSTPGAAGEGLSVDVKHEEVPVLRVHDSLTITHESDTHLVLQWVSEPITDMVTDAAVALILSLNAQLGSGRGPTMGTEEKPETRILSEKDEIEIVKKLLENLFGSVEVDKETRVFTVKVDGKVATVNQATASIECDDEKLKEKVKVALRRIQTALYPLEIPVK